jgi:hypothetical protein
MVLDFAQLRQLVELMRPGAPQLAVASRAQAAEAKPGSSNEAIAIWTTMAIRPLTCLPKGVLSYGLTMEGEVAMIRPPTKEEAFLTEPTDKAARRWAKLDRVQRSRGGASIPRRPRLHRKIPPSSISPSGAGSTSQKAGG